MALWYYYKYLEAYNISIKAENIAEYSILVLLLNIIIILMIDIEIRENMASMYSPASMIKKLDPIWLTPLRWPDKESEDSSTNKK